MQKKCLSCLLVLLVLAASLFSFFPAVYSDGESWLTGWSYRKSHTINFAAGSGTDYQIRVTVHYGADSDSGENVYLDSKCKTDFGDIRFTDNDGDTELDYWMESKTDSDNAVFLVEVKDDLSTENQLIYVYYGNSGATYIDVYTDLEHGENTFPFFDTFIGDTLDEKWSSTVGTPVVSGGTVALNDDDAIMGDTAFGYNYAMVSRAIADEQDIRFATLSQVIGLDQDNYITIANSDAWFNDDFDKIGMEVRKGLGIFTIYEQDVLSDFRSDYNQYNIFRVSGEVNCYQNSDLIGTETDSTYLPTVSLYPKLLVWDSSQESTLTVDWVYVRKYVDPEPVHGVWGSEESSEEAIFVTFYLNDGGKFYVNATDTANSTSTEYENETVLVLMAVPANFSYIFVSFNWTASSSISNPHQYTVLGSDTIWLLFDEAGVGDEDFTDPEDVAVILLGCLIFIPIILLILFVVWKKK